MTESRLLPFAVSVGFVVDATPDKQDSGVQQESQEKGHQHSNDYTPIGIYTKVAMRYGRTQLHT